MYRFITNGQPYLFNQESMVIAKENEYGKLKIDNACIDTEVYKKKYFSNVNFIMNNCCNMACDYCYANKGRYDVSGVVLDFKTAKVVIDTLEKLRKKNKGNEFHVTFFGGEPLLQFELIKEIVEYTYQIIENGVCVKWDIVTNGTILNDRIVDFLRLYHFTVTISIDGAKEVHDITRKFANGSGSYEIVSHNIKKYGEIINIVARATINDFNTDVLSAVKSIKALGVKRIVIGVDNNITDENFERLCKSVDYLFQEYRKAIVERDYYIIDNISRYILKIALRRKSKYHCSSGISYFAVSANQRVYLCHRFVGNENAHFADVNDNLVDNIQKVTEENIKKFKKDAGERIALCKNCELLNLCGGICYYDAYCKSSEMLGYSLRACKLKKLFMTLTMKLLTSLSEEDRREYLLYHMNYMSSQITEI